MTAPRPFKLNALHGVTDCLKEITPGNGYANDLSDFDPGDGITQSRVFRGRAWFGANDPIPMLSVLEASAVSDEVVEPPVNDPVGEYDWPLILQGFVNDDPENPTDPAYVLMADARRRLSQEVKRVMPGSRQPDPFGLRAAAPESCNRIVALKIGPGVVRPADDISAKAYFWLGIILRIVDNASLPYG